MNTTEEKEIYKFKTGEEEYTEKEIKDFVSYVESALNCKAVQCPNEDKNAITIDMSYDILFQTFS